MSDTATIEQAVTVFDKPDDRTLIKREAQADPRLAKVVAVMLREPDGERKVAEFAKAAVLNELNPKLFPETKGYWNLLRNSIRKVTEEMPRAIAATVARMTPEERAQAVKDVEAGRVPTFNPKMLGELGDLGQFEIIGSLVGSLVQAGASAYGAYVTNSTQRQIANMQLQAQQAQLNAQMDMARAQQAIAAAQAQQSIIPEAIQQPVQAVASALSTDIGGMPLWFIAILGFFVLKYAKFDK